MVNPAMAQQVLFLVAGQSNAVGMGDSATSVSCEPQTAWEYRLQGDSLVPLKDPVGFAELHFEAARKGSAWPAFAKAYHAATGKQVVIVAAARGGSSCHRQAELDNYGTWDTAGRLRLFDSAIVKTKAAMRKTGLPLNGIIWSQGERDANAINSGTLTATAYAQALTQLIERFRQQLGEGAKFYLVQTGYYSNHPAAGFDAVRKVQEQLANKLKQVYIVYRHTGDFKEKGWMKDDIHYNQTALNDIGTTIARIIAREENKYP